MVELDDILSKSVYENTYQGSATICSILIDDKTPIVRTANIGDSGYLLLRKVGLDLILKHQSEPKWHNFNFPHQVGTSGDDPTTADF